MPFNDWNELDDMKSLTPYFALALVFFFVNTSVASNLALQLTKLEHEVQAIERALPGYDDTGSAKIGVATLAVATGEVWQYRGGDRFPLASTFKTLACAKLLQDAENGVLDLTETVAVTNNLLQDYSPVMKNEVGNSVSLHKACDATMLTSDNTAANIVLKTIGGPSSLTRFLENIGDDITRLDRYEPHLNEGKPGDLRDTTTPLAMVNTLKALVYGDVLSLSNQKQLTGWMIKNQVTGGLLRSVLPNGWSIADRSGAGGYGTRNINAIVWSDQISPIIISIYITQTSASFDERNQAIRDIGKSLFSIYSNA